MAEQPVGEWGREARQAGTVPGLVGGELGIAARFDEKTTTVDVSARGARVPLRLQVKLEPGTEVTVENLAPGEQQVFRVARVGGRLPGGYEIGLEATDAKPGFWGA